MPEWPPSNKARARIDASPSSVVAVDLFCGGGGLTYGLRELGIDVRAGYDIDRACRYAYEANNAPAKFYERDVRRITAREIKAHFPPGAVKALVGCAPCTPFSALRKGRDTSDESEWSLLGEFARLVRKVEPDLVSMENVPQITKHAVFADFRDQLESLQYSVSASVVKCEDYGIPQKRRRLVLLASRLGEIALLPPTHPNRHRTVAQAIRKLPAIEAGTHATKDPIHLAANLEPLNLRRIRLSKPGGTWRDWPTAQRLHCHKKASGSTYDAAYGRMEWDKPSPPITTKFYNLGSGRFGHPTQDRAISVREGAILQTFPRSYKFAPAREKLKITKLGQIIGNAVPPRLGAVLGASLRRHIADFRPEIRLPTVGPQWSQYFAGLSRTSRSPEPSRIAQAKTRA